jgi:hypothetical protein
LMMQMMLGVQATQQQPTPAEGKGAASGERSNGTVSAALGAVNSTASESEKEKSDKPSNGAGKNPSVAKTAARINTAMWRHRRMQ